MAGAASLDKDKRLSSAPGSSADKNSSLAWASQGSPSGLKRAPRRKSGGSGRTCHQCGQSRNTRCVAARSLALTLAPVPGVGIVTGAGVGIHATRHAARARDHPIAPRAGVSLLASANTRTVPRPQTTASARPPPACAARARAREVDNHGGALSPRRLTLRVRTRTPPPLFPRSWMVSCPICQTQRHVYDCGARLTAFAKKGEPGSAAVSALLEAAQAQGPPEQVACGDGGEQQAGKRRKNAGYEIRSFCTVCASACACCTSGGGVACHPSAMRARRERLAAEKKRKATEQPEAEAMVSATPSNHVPATPSHDGFSVGLMSSEGSAPTTQQLSAGDGDLSSRGCSPDRDLPSRGCSPDRDLPSRGCSPDLDGATSELGGGEVAGDGFVSSRNPSHRELGIKRLREGVATYLPPTVLFTLGVQAASNAVFHGDESLLVGWGLDDEQAFFDALTGGHRELLQSKGAGLASKYSAWIGQLLLAALSPILWLFLAIFLHILLTCSQGDIRAGMWVWVFSERREKLPVLVEGGRSSQSDKVVLKVNGVPEPMKPAAVSSATRGAVRRTRTGFLMLNALQLIVTATGLAGVFDGTLLDRAWSLAPLALSFSENVYSMLYTHGVLDPGGNIEAAYLSSGWFDGLHVTLDGVAVTVSLLARPGVLRPLERHAAIAFCGTGVVMRMISFNRFDPAVGIPDACYGVSCKAVSVARGIGLSVALAWPTLKRLAVIPVDGMGALGPDDFMTIALTAACYFCAIVKMANRPKGRRRVKDRALALFSRYLGVSGSSPSSTGTVDAEDLAEVDTIATANIEAAETLLALSR